MAAVMTPEVIAERLGQAIREKVFAPGTALIQEDLAQRFQVSRNPVREALRILATEGLVTMTSGGGATVRQLTSGELHELYDLRILLEPTIAEPIVNGALARSVRELAVLADEMASTTDIAVWMRTNFAFHTALYSLADRPHTESILRTLLAAVQPYSFENIEVLGGKTQANREHLEMIDAIRHGDSHRLASLFVTHLQAAKERVSQQHRDEVDPLAALRRR